MIESEFILALQRSLNSPIGRAFIGFTARWLIYAYLAVPLFIRAVPVFRGALYLGTWSALLAFAGTSGLAAFIGRARPYLAIEGVIAVVPPNLQSGSFPSSHTAISFAIAASIFSVHHGWGLAAFAIAFLVAFGRMAAGMHYPSDVIGGIAVGLLAFACVSIIADQVKKVSV